MPTSPLVEVRQRVLRSAISPAIKTNGVLFLRWSTQGTENTVTNLTSGSSTPVGTNDNFAARGLTVGVTNTFAVMDEYGRSSNLASAAASAESYTNRVTIAPYIFRVSWDIVPGKTNTIWQTYDLKRGTWNRIVSFIGTNGNFSLLHTNSGVAGFWMVTIE